MRIEQLELMNFRNYSKLNIKFNDKLNIIIGNNAQGKTNILEAIYYLSISKSFLSINDKNVIKHNEMYSFIKGKINYLHKLENLKISITSNNKKLEVNKVEIKKHCDFIGKLKVIIYYPDSLRIIKDGPSNRRRFLNIEISQLYLKYIKLLNEFNIVLKQRNEYLKVMKSGNINIDYYNIITEKFIKLSVDIYRYRKDFIDNINKYLGDIFIYISGTSGLKLFYDTQIDVSVDNNIKVNLYEKIKSNYDREIIYGTSLIGPHRDDFSFKADNIDLLLYGSQGQQKMAVLALKLAEIDVFMDICSEYPVLLLDDLFSELDVDKRNKVISYLNRDIQTIVTTTDIDNINDEIINEAYVFKINNGEVMTDNYKTIEKGT